MHLVRKVLPQLGLLLFVSVMALLSSLGYVPSTEELGSRLQVVLATYGVGMIVVLSFIENLPGVNVYFPGSIVVLAAMAATAGDPARAVLFYFAIAAPAALANILSYRLGAHSRRGDSAGDKKSRKGSLWLWYASTYWHPHLAAITAMASGAEGVRFRSYLSHFLPVSLLWVAFWSVVMYQTGKNFPVAGSLVPLTVTYILVWLVWDLYKVLSEGREGREGHP